MAGAAGALTDNGEGIAGVAGAAPIMPVRVTDSTGRATSASLANGIVWAADHGARVVNLSFSNVAGNTTIRTAAEYAVNHGALVVAAAGNCGCVDSTPENPYILSVSATDENDGVASFSSTGPFVDLSAPGNNILTTERFGLYGTVSGTSLSSPIVAGVAGLMFAAKPTLTPALVTQLLEETAAGSGGYDPASGYGRVDAYAAVSAAAGYTPPADTTAPTVAMTAPVDGATVSGTAVVDVTADDNVGVVKVDLYVDGVYFVSDTTAPYSFAWDTTALANGSHTLQAVASDAANNSASTAPISVTVFNTPPDTTPPVVSIAAPAAGATVAGTTTVSATATDNGGVAKVELYVDGVLYATDAAAPYAFSWNTTTSSNGSHTLAGRGHRYGRQCREQHRDGDGGQQRQPCAGGGQRCVQRALPSEGELHGAGVRCAGQRQRCRRQPQPGQRQDRLVAEQGRRGDGQVQRHGVVYAEEGLQGRGDVRLHGQGQPGGNVQHRHGDGHGTVSGADRA